MKTAIGARRLLLGLVAAALAHEPAVYPPLDAAPANVSCPAAGCSYAAGSLAGLRDRAVKSVAVAFHGQFLMGRAPTKRADAILPATWLDASASRTFDVAYDAFITTSTQQREQTPCSLTDGVKLCDALHATGGFRYAACETRPYNGSSYIYWAHAMGLPWRDSARWSLYPHRVLSDFSTIERALQLVKAHEERSGCTYDLIAVTRIDVFFYFLATIPPKGQPLGAWFENVRKARVVGRRSAQKPMWEDRFIIGESAAMMSMRTICINFLKNFVRLGNLSYPEAQVYLHFADVLSLKHGRRGKDNRPPFESYATISGFRQNKNKFKRWFIEPPLDIGVGAKWRREPAAIAAPVPQPTS
mmetsp:Transcript_40947/g.94826  ORF Transcript_40947/g.94826 Transcript_40947/m.94826 type:complete len:358 (-) Transcript_40947:89-1162(-)